MKIFLKYIFLPLIILFLLLLILLNIVEAPNGFFSQQKEKEVTLLFVGDIMLGRNVEVLMELNGPDHIFASTSEIFDKADMVIANLEGPIPDNHVHTKSGEMSFSFPPATPELLHANGIDIVSLANNHTYDKGKKVFEETVSALKSVGIESFGHPTVQSSSYTKHFKVNDIPFSLIGFNATYTTFDLTEAVQTINEVKVKYPEDTVIVFMHWGNEYELVSSIAQKEISEQLHNAGANLVIGAHPHVTQEINCQGLHRCTIFSLGNFIFDQYFSKDVEEGMVAYVTLGTEGMKEIEIVSIAGNHSQPKKMAQNMVFMESLLKRSILDDIQLSTSDEDVILK